MIVSSVVSTLGGRVSMVAIPWLVLTTTHSPEQMGLVIVGSTVPYLLSSAFGAPIADRLGLRTAVIGADLFSALTTAVVAATPNVGVWVIIAMSALSGVVRGSSDRSKHVILRPVTEAAGVRMIRITAVYDGLANGATLVGAPLAGVLVQWVGAQGAIWVDASTFVVSAALVAFLVRLPPGHEWERKPEPEPYLTALRGGARHLVRDRLLLGMIVMTFFANVVNQAHTALFVPLWVAEVLHSPTALGTVLGAFAAGALLGNLVFTTIAPKLPRYLTFTVCVALSGTPRILVLAMSRDLVLVLAVTFVCGLAVAGVNPILGVMLYERVPSALQNRVFGLVATVSFAGYPVGGLLAGWAITGFGLNTAILLGAAIYVIATGLPLLHYRKAVEPSDGAEAHAMDGPANR
jgi:MFS family permease